MAVRFLSPVFCLGLLLALLATGCRQGPDALAPVKGKVLYRGRPLPGGIIVFVPDNSRGTHGNLAIAEIKSDGTFILKTNDLAGAMPGHHKVTVSYVLSDPTGALPQSILPSKYRDPDQSGLVCEVVADKHNSIDFELQ